MLLWRTPPFAPNCSACRRLRWEERPSTTSDWPNGSTATAATCHTLDLTSSRDELGGDGTAARGFAAAPRPILGSGADRSEHRHEHFGRERRPVPSRPLSVESSELRRRRTC